MAAPAAWNPPWRQADWLEAAGHWIDALLKENNLVRRGPLDQFHIEPWSTVMRIATADGAYFFKAGGPNQHMEPALLEILASARPDDTPRLLAVDKEQGWSITADGGPTLRQTLGDSDPRPHFIKLLPQYAEYQIATMSLVDELLTAGCPDRQLEVLPEQFEAMVTDKALLDLENQAVLSKADHTQLLGMRPTVEDLCSRVTQAGIAAAIEHSDLHTANVFADGERYTFFDWGDACVSHPFFSLVVTMRSLAGELNSQDPALHWARDAYLEPFSAFGSMTELRSAFDAAQHLGRFQRSLSWLHELRSIGPEHLDSDRENLPAWLWLFLHFPEEKY